MSNARTKRLNESQNPIIDGGIADDLHKIILPQNTTTNLSEITPSQTASIAYDTTLNTIVVNTGSAFVPIVSGSTTVTPGSYINASITVDQQGRLTAASNGTSTLVFTSNTGAGGAASATLTVTGLLATDTVLSVSQKIAGTNSLPLLGWTTVANNALTVQWSGDPGVGSVVIISIKR